MAELQESRKIELERPNCTECTISQESDIDYTYDKLC